MKSKRLVFFISVLTILVTVFACNHYFFRSNYENGNALIHETENLKTKPFLKAHLKNGDVCILKDSWIIDSLTVSGTGTRYDYNRVLIHEGELQINIADVAIFEANTKLIDPENERVTTLQILTGLDVVLGIYCLTNRKACFGSCPTFYLKDSDNIHFANAEGFSNAIAPSLEYADIDALNNESISDKNITITMKNEALETHCIKDVHLLAYPRKRGERVYHSHKDEFYLSNNIHTLTRGLAVEGDVTDLLKWSDKNDRFSLADEQNINSREEITLEFNNTEDMTDPGLIINFRQTLMTTYFIYSAMGYMGDEIGDYMAKLETDSEMQDNLKNGIYGILGDIDVYQWNEQDQNWHFVDGVYETGPIAFNQQIIPLQKQNSASQVKLKLVLNKGLWRIDYLALTNIIKKVTLEKYLPVSVNNVCSEENTALSKINSEEEYLVSMPGDIYQFNFTLPDNSPDYELFLYSKGYYLEWMRENWIQDKDLFKLWQMFKRPEAYLKAQASDYKEYEKTMEKEFWNSKINREMFSYYEK